MLCLHVIQSYATHVYNQTRYKYNRQSKEKNTRVQKCQLQKKTHGLYLGRLEDQNCILAYGKYCLIVRKKLFLNYGEQHLLLNPFMLNDIKVKLILIILSSTFKLVYFFKSSFDSAILSCRMTIVYFIINLYCIEFVLLAFSQIGNKWVAIYSTVFCSKSRLH